METIQFVLSVVGAIFLVVCIWAASDWLYKSIRCMCLQWQFHSDSANENTRKIRKLEQEVAVLQGDQIELRHAYGKLTAAIEAQPKKAKSK